MFTFAFCVALNGLGYHIPFGLPIWSLTLSTTEMAVNKPEKLRELYNLSFLMGVLLNQILIPVNAHVYTNASPLLGANIAVLALEPLIKEIPLWISYINSFTIPFFMSSVFFNVIMPQPFIIPVVPPIVPVAPPIVPQVTIPVESSWDVD